MQIKETQNFDILSLLGNSAKVGASEGKVNALSQGESAEQDQEAFLKLLEGEGLSSSDLKSLSKQGLVNVEGEELEAASRDANENSEEVLMLSSKAQKKPVKLKGELAAAKATHPQDHKVLAAKVQKDSGLHKLASKEFANSKAFIPTKSLGSESFIQGKLQMQGTKNPAQVGKTVIPQEQELNSSEMLGAKTLNTKKEVLEHQNIFKLGDLKNNQPKLNLRQYEQSSNAFDSKLLKPVKEKEVSNKLEKLSSRDDMTLRGSHEVRPFSEALFAGAINGAGNIGKNPEFGLNKNLDSLEVKGKKTENTIDLSQVDAKNSSELIKKVSDYITRSFVENSQSIDVVVNHDDLGQFKVSAQKVGNQGAVDLEIQANKLEGQNFFKEHEVELVRTLSQSGVKLSDVKITTPVELGFSSDVKLGSSDLNFSQGQHQGDSQYSSSRDFSGSRQHQQQRESDRRRELWEEFERQRA